MQCLAARRCLVKLQFLPPLSLLEPELSLKSTEAQDSQTWSTSVTCKNLTTFWDWRISCLLRGRRRATACLAARPAGAAAILSPQDRLCSDSCSLWAAGHSCPHEGWLADSRPGPCHDAGALRVSFIEPWVSPPVLSLQVLAVSCRLACPQACRCMARSHSCFH